MCSCCVQGTMKVFHLTAGPIFPQLLRGEENADLGLANPRYPCPSATKTPSSASPRREARREEASLGKHMQATLLAVRAALRALLTLRQCGAAVVSLEGTFCISHICRNTKCCWMQTIQGLIG